MPVTRSQANQARTSAILHQSGFTAVELFVALILISLLGLYFGQGLTGRSNDAKVRIAKTQVTDIFPKAIQNFYLTHASGTAITKAALEERGARGETAWSGQWCISPDHNTLIDGIQIGYTVQPPGGPDLSANQLAIDSVVLNGSGRVRPQWAAITDYQSGQQPCGTRSLGFYVTYRASLLPTHR